VTGLVVLHVSGSRFPPLPIEHHTLAIWRELATIASEYHVLARSIGRHGSETREGRIQLHLLPSIVRRDAESLITSFAVLSLVRRIQPAVIVCQSPVFGGLAATVAAWLHEIPTFVELHGEHYFRDRQRSLRARLLQKLAAPALKRARVIRVLSPDMQVSLGRTFGAAIAAKAVVVPTRVDMALFGPAKDDYRTQDSLRLVTVGSFIPVKNHLALIQAVAGLERVHLTVIGQGPLLEQYRVAITQAGLADRIALRPWVSQRELAGMIRDHDAYVHYSVSEALPRAILEAMALGLPVISTRVGFMGGLLEHDVNALLLDPPWNASLATAIHRLAGSESLRRALGSAAVRTVKCGYEWNAVFDRYREAIVAAAESRQVARLS
jgi:glycosyltransferase involved in cell wall biosynthesis